MVPLFCWCLSFGGCLSGFTDRWPSLIKVNAIANIANGVKESISARRKAESVSEAELKQAERRRSPTSFFKAFKDKLFPARKSKEEESASDSDEKLMDEKEKAARRSKLALAQALLHGKRESAVDDILWGVFQISLVFFDMGRWQVVGHAWMLFLLNAMEKTVFNEKLNQNQKWRKFAWLSFTAYLSGKIMFY